MSRVKHLIALAVKLAFLVLVFAATMVMSAMQTATTDAISIGRDINKEYVEIVTENGAEVSWEVVDGELVFDIRQTGDKYDDISVFLTFPNVEYDSSFIRSMLGDDAGEHEEFISEMENGPWLAHCNFCLKGESFLTVGNNTYTFFDGDMNKYVKSVSSSGANTTDQTEGFTVRREDGAVTIGLIFGAEGEGAMDSGRYTLTADLKLLHPEGEQLDLGLLEQAGAILKFGARAVSEAGMNIFNVTNWLVFYGMLVLLGWFVYLWRDLRAMAKIFFAILDGDGTSVIVRTYINGVFSEEYTMSNGGNFFIAAIVTVLCYVVFLVTIPIRMLIHIIRDIIYLFAEDDSIEGFSLVGNFLGSVGIYALLVGMVGLLSASYAVGGIGAGIGIALCIIARILCKRREEEYG